MGFFVGIRMPSPIGRKALDYSNQANFKLYKLRKVLRQDKEEEEENG